MAHEMEDVPHEVIETTAAQASEVPTIEQTIKQEIKKFNLADVAIAELRKQYTGLKISGLEDKKGYELVRMARADVRGKRTGVEKMRKHVKSDYIIIGKEIDKEADRLTVMLEEIEGPLAAELKRIDDEKEAIENQKKEAEAAALKARVDTLVAAGIQFNGMYYAIGETVSIDVVTLKALTDADFENLLTRVKKENEAILQAKADKERLEQEERDRLRIQQEEQEAERVRLANEQEQIRKDREEMKRTRTALRYSVLENAGFIGSGASKEFLIFELSVGNLVIYVYQFSDLTGDEFDTLFAKLKGDISRLRQLQAEKDEAEAEQKRKDLEELQRKQAEDKKKAEIFDARKLQLINSFGMTPTQTGLLISGKHDAGAEVYTSYKILSEADEQEFDTLVKTLQVEIEDLRERDKKAEQQKEAARLAALSDVEKVDEYLATLAQIRRPEFESKHIAAAFSLFDQSVANSIDYLRKTLDAIK